ncbi:MAG: hypothetical protein M3071_18425 [Actinomycetota bacterium]|nr:hypothetical protein [Actinomycetota bacterium]
MLTESLVGRLRCESEKRLLNDARILARGQVSQLCEKLRDRACLSSNRETAERFSTRITVGILQSGHESAPQAPIVTPDLRAQSKRSPVADGNVRVGRELDQRLNSQVVIEFKQAEHDAEPDPLVSVCSQAMQSRDTPDVLQMTKRSRDARKDLNGLLAGKVIEEQLGCRPSERSLVNGNTRLSTELSDDLDRENPSGRFWAINEVGRGAERAGVASRVQRPDVDPAFMTVDRERQRRLEDLLRSLHPIHDAARCKLEVVTATRVCARL